MDEIEKALFGPNSTRGRRKAALARRQAEHAERSVRRYESRRKVAAMPSKILNTKVSVADIGGGIGRGIGAVGTGTGKVLTAKPGVTGAVALGGGGYGLYRLGQRPKKSQVKKSSLSAFGVDHIEKGWGANTAARAAQGELKSALKAKQATRAKEASYGVSRGELRSYDAHNDFARRSNRKSVNFVERFSYDGNGQRSIAKPGLKTSLPRSRSLTSEDKRYLGLPGGEKGTGTTQGYGPVAHAGGKVNYELTGNKRVRKDAFGVDSIEKWGSPKAKIQEASVQTQDKKGVLRQYDADALTAHYQGKSLILRRPKYQATAHPGKKASKAIAGAEKATMTATPNMRMKTKYAQRVHDAHQNKASKIKIQGREFDFIGKNAFGINHEV